MAKTNFQNGKCPRAANVTGRQMSCFQRQTSQGGKSIKTANVFGLQRSRKALSQKAKGSSWQRGVFNGNCLTKAKVTEAKRALYLGAVLDGICHRKANGQWQMSLNGICLSWQMVGGIWDKEAKGRRQIGNGIRDSGIWNPSRKKPNLKYFRIRYFGNLHYDDAGSF